MKSDYNKRLEAIKTLLRKESSILEGAKSDAHSARSSLSEIHRALDTVRQEVGRLEQRRRAGLGRNQLLSLERLELEGAYLEQKRQTEAHKEAEHQRATGQMTATTARVQKQYLKVKGLEEAGERVTELLRREDEKVSYREADDLWIQKRGSD
jgi:hypothetical protein